MLCWNTGKNQVSIGRYVDRYALKRNAGAKALNRRAFKAFENILKTEGLNATSKLFGINDIVAILKCKNKGVLIILDLAECV